MNFVLKLNDAKIKRYKAFKDFPQKNLSWTFNKICSVAAFICPVQLCVTLLKRYNAKGALQGVSQNFSEELCRSMPEISRLPLSEAANHRWFTEQLFWKKKISQEHDDKIFSQS